MKRNSHMMCLYFIVCITFIIPVNVYSQWKPVQGIMQTEWAKEVTPEKVLPEYPRPIMERKDWKNLNGLWDYAIIRRGNMLPDLFEGKILVPFAIESSLSGVGKHISDNEELVYQRFFTLPSSWKGKEIILHFGAVDWKAEVWVNDIKVGNHIGGYTPFSFNITPALQVKGSNKLVVRVFDPTDKGFQPRGKQVSKPSGIWYTSVSGIWQTVWLEPVNRSYIQDLKISSDIDLNMLKIESIVSSEDKDLIVIVKVFDGIDLVAENKSICGQTVDIIMPENRKLWSPDNPFLYWLEVTLLKKDGKILDWVKSYAAMRKYSIGRDKNGIVRLELNNEPLFQFGLLDQGWWPDGLYTAPTDEALLYDIQQTKALGFNMIRKHVKVEPARWYSYCDKIGLIVWQDMPNGDRISDWVSKEYYDGREMKRSSESEENYLKEWKDIIDHLYSYPCIGTWIPFNEAWGQFNTKQVVAWTKDYDPSRLVNPASGGNHFTCGDMLDLHSYPNPQLYLYDAQRANVLGEYGGIALALEGHLWEKDENWGYVKFDSPNSATNEYVKYANELLNLVNKGLSGAVYTQTTDVEKEVNGLMTYDRKVLKLNKGRLKEINDIICHIFDK